MTSSNQRQAGTDCWTVTIGREITTFSGDNARQRAEAYYLNESSTKKATSRNVSGPAGDVPLVPQEEVK